MSVLEAARPRPLLAWSAVDAGRWLSLLLGASLFCWWHIRIDRPVAGSPASHDLLLYPCQLLAVALVALHGCRGLARTRPGGRLLWAGAAIWLASAVAAIAVAQDRALAGWWVGGLAVALGCVLGGLDRAAFRRGLGIGVVVSLPVMVYQAAAQTTWPAGTLLGWPGDLTGAVRGTAVLGAGRWLRPYGLTLHPNIAGGFAAVACVLFAASFLERRSSRWVSAAELGVAVAALGEVLLSFSRSAWIGVLLGLAMLCWMYRARAWKTMLVALAVPAVLFGLALFPLVVERTQATGQLEADSVSQRVYLAAMAMGVWRAQPLLGIGPAQLPQREVDVYGTSFTPEPVHNAPLLVLAETGAAGLLGAGLLAAALAWGIVRQRDWPRAATGLALASPLLLDHYLLTSGPGVLLLALALAPNVQVCMLG